MPAPKLFLISDYGDEALIDAVIGCWRGRAAVLRSPPATPEQTAQATRYEHAARMLESALDMARPRDPAIAELLRRP